MPKNMMKPVFYYLKNAKLWVKKAIGMISRDEEVSDPELCNQCGESVAFGSERFVNRLPSSFDKGEAPFDTEWMCAECFDTTK
jgi:hypothetical protein